MGTGGKLAKGQGHQELNPKPRSEDRSATSTPIKPLSDMFTVDVQRMENHRTLQAFHLKSFILLKLIAAFQRPSTHVMICR
jgi:hypothetical protein